MSSDQFSDTPLPQEKRCSQCGQVTTSDAGMCWLCLERFSVQEGLHKPPLPPGEPKSTKDNAAWAVVGVIAIVLTVAIAIEMPGVLLVLIVFATPALIRAIFATEKEPRGAPTSIGTFTMIFFSSLGIASFTGSAAIAAFVAICFSIGAVGILQFESMAVVIFGVIAGIIAGTTVAVFLFKRLWK